jgi:hypothetical protein
MARISGKPKGLVCTDATLRMPIQCCCGYELGGITRDIWVPDVVLTSRNFRLNLPEVDTARLHKHGVYLQCRCFCLTWDYHVNQLSVDLLPLVLNLDIDDETVALIVGILREAKWKNTERVFSSWQEHCAIGQEHDCAHNSEDLDDDED